MSEIILEFADPLLKDAKDNKIRIESAVGFSVVVWNLSLFPEDKFIEGRESIIRESKFKDEAKITEMENLINMLLERKEKYFKKERRVVSHYYIDYNGNEMRLDVVSGDIG